MRTIMDNIHMWERANKNGDTLILFNYVWLYRHQKSFKLQYD
jgi:hypothetical protein